DYYINNSNANQPVGMYPNDPNFQYSMKRKGDKILTDYEGKVMWGGIFAQIEYKKQKWSAFVTGSISETGYQRKDYFRKKDLVLSDTTLSQVIGFADVITYNGVQYDRNSPEAKTSTTKRKWFLGYTAKAGANYNINGHQNVFINAGYLKMAPKFDLVFTTTNLENTKVKMTEVVAAEIGYGIKYKKFATNINLYYTSWRNKPLSEFPTIRISGNDYYYQLNGLNANHSGIELDFIYKLSKNLDIEGLASIGDWTTQTQDEVYLFDVNTDLIYDTVQFSAKGIHVGDAAQIQLGGSIRYEIVKNLFIKARYTYFAKNYSKFALLDLGVTYNTNGTIRADNRDRESWKIPDYGLLDLFAGYNFNYWKLRFTISAGVTNALNTVYINDAMNGSGFNASSSIVYMGTGTKFNIGLKISF
ncbi:MAG: TonB-dependent receptor, partial [Chitinophagaceae bacterium]|nr:TonB-dependent receptor [Chitinophagaceae bacterium]